MPGMDGIEVLRLIRSNPATKSIPVIIASAIADPGFRTHAIEKGANDYWVKGSVDFSRLPEMIGRYFEERLNNQEESEGPLVRPATHSGLGGWGLQGPLLCDKAREIVGQDAVDRVVGDPE